MFVLTRRHALRALAAALSLATSACAGAPSALDGSVAADASALDSGGHHTDAAAPDAAPPDADGPIPPPDAGPPGLDAADATLEAPADATLEASDGGEADSGQAQDAAQEQPGDDGGRLDAAAARPDAEVSVPDGGGTLTWTDSATGLEWTQTNGTGDLDQDGAARACSESGGGWRLPSIDELRTTVRGCPGSEAGGGCPVGAGCPSPACLTSACGCADLGAGCYRDPGFMGACEWFWSSTSAGGPVAWALNFRNASFAASDVSLALNYRCVR